MADRGDSFVMQMGYLELCSYLTEAGVDFGRGETVTELRIRCMTYVGSLKGACAAAYDQCVPSATRPLTGIQSVLLGNLSAIPILDVIEPRRVLAFFVEVDRLQSSQLVDSVFFLQSLLPRVTGLAGAVLSDVISRGGTYQEFKEQVIVTVGSSRVWKTVKAEKVNRFQRREETVPGFVQSVYNYARALNLVDEVKLINNILDHLRPDVKSLRSLFPRPSTWSDLRRLAVDLQREIDLNEEYRKVNGVEGMECDRGKTTGRVTAGSGMRRGETGRSEFTAGRLAMVSRENEGVPGQSGRCSNCLNFGHRAFQCDQARVSPGERRCFRCRAVGHYRLNCPSGNGASPSV